MKFDRLCVCISRGISTLCFQQNIARKFFATFIVIRYIYMHKYLDLHLIIYAYICWGSLQCYENLSHLLSSGTYTVKTYRSTRSDNNLIPIYVEFPYNIMKIQYKMKMVAGDCILRDIAPCFVRLWVTYVCVYLVKDLMVA